MEFEKYHKIKVLGDEDNKGIFDDLNDEIIIEEKMDGGNFRFAIINDELVMGSHSRVLDEDNPNSKFFKRCIEFIKLKITEKDLLNLKKNYSNMIFYGECMVKHTFDYDWEKIPPYLGFDIKLFSDQTKYIEYDKKVEIFKTLGLPVVPLIKRIKAKDMVKITDDNIPNSAYANPKDDNWKQAEGIVIKNYKRQLFSKYVREKFKEQNKTTFGMPKKWARTESDEALVVATYCTNARIEKIIFKLLEENNKLEMPLMQHLPKRVTNDIFEEHWREICLSNWSVNFKGIRKKITARCLAVLKQMIVNSALK